MAVWAAFENCFISTNQLDDVMGVVLLRAMGMYMGLRTKQPVKINRYTSLDIDFLCGLNNFVFNFPNLCSCLFNGLKKKPKKGDGELL